MRNWQVWMPKSLAQPAEMTDGEGRCLQCWVILRAQCTIRLVGHRLACDGVLAFVPLVTALGTDDLPEFQFEIIMYRKTSHNVPVKSQDAPCSRSPLRKLGCHVNIQWLPNYTPLSGKELFKETEIQNTLSKVYALNCISLQWISVCKVNIVIFDIPNG